MISIVSDNSYKLIRPELYPTTTDSPNESIASAEVGRPFDVLKIGVSFKTKRGCVFPMVIWPAFRCSANVWARNHKSQIQNSLAVVYP